jgi:hypothetical protein
VSSSLKLQVTLPRATAGACSP